MLHDAHIEVTCDGKGCHSTVNVEMEFSYLDYTGKNGYYDHEDSKIEARLVEDFDWLVVPDLKQEDDKDEKNLHFCCAQCASPTVYV